MWRVVRGGWCVEGGVCGGVVCGGDVWRVVCGGDVWRVVCGGWCVEVVCGGWCVEGGVWRVVCGGWCVEVVCGGWCVKVVCGRLEGYTSKHCNVKPLPLAYRCQWQVDIRGETGEEGVIIYH